MGLDGYIIFRCDRNVNTSNSRRGGGKLIAVHSKFRPVIVLSPIISVEQVFVRITLPGGASILLAGIYLPPNSDISKYEHHTEFLDHVWESYKFDSGIVCEDFNLPNISWTNGVSCLEYNGCVTDKVRQIGDQYGTLHFEQINTVSNKFNSVLDLVFSNSKSITVEKSPEALVPCDDYHPAIVITCTCPTDIPVLIEQHSYRDFKGANYE